MEGNPVSWELPWKKIHNILNIIVKLVKLTDITEINTEIIYGCRYGITVSKNYRLPFKLSQTT